MSREYIGSEVVRDWDIEVPPDSSPMATIFSMITGLPIEIWEKHLPALGISSPDGTQAILRPNPVDDLRHDENMRGFGFQKVEREGMVDLEGAGWSEYTIKEGLRLRVTSRTDFRQEDLVHALPYILGRDAVAVTALRRGYHDPRSVPHLLIGGQYVEGDTVVSYIVGDPYVAAGVQELTLEQLQARISPTQTEFGMLRSWIVEGASDIY